MNSLQIEGLLKKDLQAKKIFKKVCGLDEIEVPSYPFTSVINSDTRDKKGEHWWLYTLTKPEEENTSTPMYCLLRSLV